MKKNKDIILTKDGEETLDRMKHEYHAYKAPEELKEKLEMIATENKKKKSKTKFVWIGTRVFGGAVAAMAAITLLANSNQDIAMAMQKVPALGQIAKVVTFRTYENDTKGFEANVKVPEIEATDSKAAKKVNHQIEDYVDKLIAEHEDAICNNQTYEDEYGEMLTNKQSLDTQYTVLTDNDRLLSIRLDTTIVMAGSNAFSQIYHIDKQNDKEITLKDLFKEDSDYVNLLSKDMKKQMREQMKADENISYFIDSDDMAELDFKKIKENQNFYINKSKQLVLVFDKYEVAPGYMGQVEFTIDSSVWKDSLSNLGESVLK